MGTLTARLSQLYERTAVLVAAYDESDRLRYANPAFKSAFFIAKDDMPLWPDLMRRNFLAGRGTVIRNPDFEAWIMSAQSRRGKVGFRAFETDLIDGRWLWMTETVQADGWMLCIASDITSLRADERSLRQDRDFAIREAYTDELTGIANRRFMTARVDEMLLQSDPRDGILGCLAILDIDNFKYVNDRYGHHNGDLILQDFAKLVHAQVRRADTFGRMGGEEFLLVLPNTREEEAILILQRMLAAIRSSRPLSEWPDCKYTFSAGIAAGKKGATAASLYAAADRALYSAKIAGRNRIHVDEDPTRDQFAVV